MLVKKDRTFQISNKAMEKYNVENTTKVIFTENSLESLKLKYRKVRGLPGFLHNTLTGRPTPDREILIENPDFCAWTQNFNALIIPNVNNLDAMRKDPLSVKDTPEGLSLVAWAMHPSLLTKYKLNDSAKNQSFSIHDFLIKQNKDDVESSYQFFKRTHSQEKIEQLQLMDETTPYLATILDLTPEHLEFLYSLRDTAKRHIAKVYGVDPTQDFVEMFFHFPTYKITTTLHLHICINEGKHPYDIYRSFALKDIINCLESGISIKDMVLAKNPYYIHRMDMLPHIDSLEAIPVKNPFFLSSPTVIFDGISLNFPGLDTSSPRKSFQTNQVDDSAYALR